MVSVAANMEGRGIAALTGTIVGYEIVEDHVEYIIELQCELIPTQDYSDEEIDTDYVEGNGSSFGDSANDFVCGAVQEEPQCIRWCISRRYNAFRRFTLIQVGQTPTLILVFQVAAMAGIKTFAAITDFATVATKKDAISVQTSTFLLVAI